QRLGNTTASHAASSCANWAGGIEPTKSTPHLHLPSLRSIQLCEGPPRSGQLGPIRRNRTWGAAFRIAGIASASSTIPFRGSSRPGNQRVVRDCGTGNASSSARGWYGYGNTLIRSLGSRHSICNNFPIAELGAATSSAVVENAYSASCDFE